MRAKKRSSSLKPGFALRFASHAAMGVALGLAFAQMMTCIPSFGVAGLIGASADLESTWVASPGM
jgi:hypothetical protein